MSARKEVSEEKRQSRRQASGLGTMDVLQRLKAYNPCLWEQAEVVGVWVWIEFEQKPSEEIREFLLDTGFHWNQKRECWQHACGQWTAHSPGNPRWKYATIKPAEMEQAA